MARQHSHGSWSDGSGRLWQRRHRKCHAAAAVRAAAAAEALESRCLLSGVAPADAGDSAWRGTVAPGAAVTGAASIPTRRDDAEAGPLAKGGRHLSDLYTAFEASRLGGATFAGAGGASLAGGLADLLDVRGDRVAVSVQAAGELAPLTEAARRLGMDVSAANTNYRAIEGYVPIAQLPALAADPAVGALRPAYRPLLNQAGAADNQADRAQFADLARGLYGLTGAGVKVGVISDSVNRFGTGLAGSVASGDLPNNVQVLLDGQPGDTDEGRAMLELIHDIAPGAALAFASGKGPQGIATAVNALRQAGCQVIVDDVTSGLEPFYQEGVVGTAISQAVGAGVTYFSSAANSGNAGFERQSVYQAVGAQTFIDFDASPFTFDTAMTITTTATGTLIFQWSNPWNGVSGNVTTDLDIQFYDPSGTLLLAQGNDNNITQTGFPGEVVSLPAGTYQVRILVKQSTFGVPLPAYYKFTGRLGTLTTEYAGTRSSTFGHNAGLDTVSVGAVPFFGAPPFSSTSPIRNDSYSSTGPVTYLFDANGVPLPSPQTLLKPDLSGIDIANTSFFGEDIPQDADTFPNFGGTSAAAPNVAAVAALIKQFAPSATPAQLYSALVSTATPLNGAAAGAWDPQGGYGLVNAVKAAARFDLVAPAADVVDVSPDPRTTPVDSVTIRFSEPVFNFDAGDLRLTRNGATVALGSAQAPLSGDNITWTVGNLSGLTAAAGSYTLTVAASSDVTDFAGNRLAGDASDSWTVNAVVQPPEIRVQAGATLINDGQAAAADFGSVAQGQPGVERVFSVFNDGGSALSLGAVNLPAGYVLAEALAASIPAGGSDTFTVRLDTSSAGTKEGDVSFTTNDPDENPFNFPITGVVTPPAQLPDLTPFTPAGWADKIVLSTAPGTHADAAQITAADTLYVDSAYINRGAGPATARILARLLVDGQQVFSYFFDPPLDPNIYVFFEDAALGPFAPGPHTITLEADFTGDNTESDETNNTYTRPFTVVAAVSAAPGAPDLLAASDTGSSATDNLTNRDNGSAAKALQFAVPGTVPGALVEVLADGQVIGSATAPAGATTTVVTTAGALDLADGAHQITARQTEPGRAASPASAALSLNVDTAAPRVDAVLVAGSGWQASFLDWLGAHGLGASGAAAGGFAVAAGAAQLQALPWGNLDTLRLRFSEPIAAGLGASSLAVTGVSVPAYALPAAGFALGDGGRVASWALAAGSFFGLDKLRLSLPAAALADAAGNALDGEWADGADAYPSGDGAPGGDFRFRLNVAPGDVDRNGRVDAFDTLAVRAKQGSNATTSTANYSAPHDFDGNGRIDAFDTLGVRAKQGTNLNTQVPGEPASATFSDARIAAAVVGSADELDELLN